MSSGCNNEISGPSSSNDSALSAESGATTPAPSSDVPAGTTPPTTEDQQEFQKRIEEIASAGRIDRERAKLEHLEGVVIDRLNHCGLALHKVSTLKADRGANIDLIADAAQAHRQIEREALKAVNEYIDEVAAQRAATEARSGQ